MIHDLTLLAAGAIIVIVGRYLSMWRYTPLALDRSSLICLRMALAQRLSWIDEEHYREQPRGTSRMPSEWAPLKSRWLIAEQQRALDLLEKFPEP